MSGHGLIQQQQTYVTFKHTTNTNSRDRCTKWPELAVDKPESISDNDNAYCDIGNKRHTHVSKSEIVVNNKDVLDEINTQDGTLSCTEDFKAEKAHDDSQRIK